jgi:hypothetical protein
MPAVKLPAAVPGELIAQQTVPNNLVSVAFGAANGVSTPLEL